MFDFGIEGYRPRWSSGRSSVVAGHGHRLRALVGRPLTCVWLVWDLEDDEWFRDCPVLLDFSGERVEINHRKFDDLSITWNTVDPARPVLWPGLELRWRFDADAELLGLRGQVLRDVELLEWSGRDAAEGTLAVSFLFRRDRLTIANALDENELTLGPPDSRYRPHSRRVRTCRIAGDSDPGS
ncbi:hypothetical protein [Streptomyces sp. NPDC016845]|uniref:hypothetical protein n=1 Tax=Streptomyces sp. NPDC016845 TaxID=3364972 RepID=UPI0037B63397